MNGKPNWPPPKNAAASATARANPSRNTGPEVRLRKALHALGLRFRKHYRVVDGEKRPPEVDIAFPRFRLAVQVHGAFWHGRKPLPKHNREYWAAKLARNVKRDEDVVLRLKRANWRVVTVWDDWTLQKAVSRVRTAIRRREGE